MALRRNNQSNQVTEPKTKWKSSWKYFKAYFFFLKKVLVMKITKNYQVMRIYGDGVGFIYVFEV